MAKKKLQQKSQKKPQQKSKKRLKWYTYLIINLRKIVISIIIFLLIILLIFICCKELRKDIVLLEPFEVSQDLEKHGYTGRVITNKLIDQINFIRTNSSTGMKHLLFTSTWSQPRLEIEVTGIGVSINSVFQYIRKLFGIERKSVIGEIVFDKNQIFITTRVIGNPPKKVSGELKNLDLILRKTAAHIYKYTHPFVLASYLYGIDKKACLGVIQFSLSHEPLYDDPWAYNLWGVLLSDLRKYEEAIEKFEKAIILDPKFAIPYNNLGRTLFYQKEYERAIECYQIAIDLDSKFVDPHCSFGYYLISVKEDDEGALKHYQKAVDIDQKSSIAFNGRGNYYFYKKEYEKAISDFERAIQLNPKDLAPYLNISELYVLIGEPKKVLYYVNELLFLSPTLDQLVISFYFKYISEKLLNIDTTESEEKLTELIESYKSPDFSVYQFKLTQTIEGLCQAINVDIHDLSLKDTKSQIDMLNELLKLPDFYDKLCQRKKNINFSVKVKMLAKKTKKFQNSKFSTLSEENQNNIKKLNRLSLEEAYPLETPKSKKSFTFEWDFGLFEEWLSKNKEIDEGKKRFIEDKLKDIKNLKK